jgi:hypothetical protein
MTEAKTEKPVEEPNSTKDTIPKIKYKKIKEILKTWSRNVDINCYTKIIDYRPNYKVQFIWLLILLGSTGATFYFISKSIIDYLKYDVVSQTNIVSEIPTEFPTVTFCDNNPLSTKYSQQALTDALNKNKSQLSILSTSDEQLKRFGLNWNQILSCTFMFANCLNDLHWYWSYSYGNCWQFNSGLNLTNQRVSLEQSSTHGHIYGLNIEIFPLYNNNDLSVTTSNGMVVFVQNSSFKPSTPQVSIEPGKLSNIEIERTFYQKCPSPYSECIDLASYSSDLYNYIKNAGKYSYRQQDCFELCLQKNVINACKCFLIFIANLSTTFEPCLTQSQNECSVQQYLSFDLSECKSQSCPLECDTIKYDLSVSSQAYPAKAYFENVLNNSINRNTSLLYLNESLTYDIMREYALSFNVYYPYLGYTSLTESPKTSITDLFSQIGGSLSLFVSFSIFTLFEIMELIILVIHGLLAKETKISASEKE